MRFRINGVDIGSISFPDMAEGPYFPVSQTRRYGPFLTLSGAKAMVEDNAAYDVYTYPTRGNA